ncbi:hypothetical protein PHISP_00280 [Aspergillus sp. HF37]|nr:hypothetical protein PHISP_00280 [Aspergillus sp. HF37]
MQHHRLLRQRNRAETGNNSGEQEGSASKWEEAKDQVLGQLKVARAAAPLHAQLTLGGYLERYDDDDDDEDNGRKKDDEENKAKPYHYRKDSDKIQKILEHLVDNTKQAS